MPEHNTITDPEIHEPKGVSTATSGQVYVADGGGSGTWTTLTGTATVTVNSISDFPAAAGGVITLADDTTYILGADVSTGDRFVAGNNSAIIGQTFFGPTLTYTGSGDMFTGSDTNFRISNIRLDCASGTVFNFSETTGNTTIFESNSVVVENCAKFGTFNKLLSTLIVNTSCQNADDGISLLGSNQTVISFRQLGLVSTSATFVGIDFGSSVQNTVEMTDLFLSAPSGAVGISGLASNGNINANFVATVSFGTFTGGLTPLSGITSDDFRWRFLFNAGIRDTKADGMVSLTNNATATTIASTSTPVKVAGTFVVERESHFTGDTTGRVTYDGEVPIIVPIDVSATLDPSAGTNQSLRAYIAINGSVVTNSGKEILVDTGSPEGVSVLWQEELTNGDYIEVFVENNTSTNNIVVKDLLLRVR